MRHLQFFVCLLTVGLCCALCLGQTVATSALTTVKAADNLPPSRDTFEAEVERLKKQVVHLQAHLDDLQNVREQSRNDSQQLRNALREHDTLMSNANESYRVAWDRVHQLRSQGAGDQDIAQAVADAQRIETQYLPQRELDAQKHAEIDAKYQAMQSKFNDLDKDYKDTRQAFHDAQAELRDVESALKSYGREEWYEKYIQALARRNNERARKSERERDQAKWREQWVEMTPLQQTVENKRLEAEVAQLDTNRTKLHQTQMEMLVQLREITDRRSAIMDQNRAFADESRAYMQKYYDLRRSGAPQAELDKAKLAADEASKVRKIKQDELKAQLDAISAERETISNAVSELSQEMSRITDDWSAMRALFLDSQARLRVSDHDKELKQWVFERDTQREAWAKAAGRTVIWEDNPYYKQPVKMEGGVSNSQTHFRLAHDTRVYHSRMTITNLGKQLTVLDAQGRVVFDGPVDTLEQRASMTLDVYYLWEFMNAKVMINGQ